MLVYCEMVWKVLITAIKNKKTTQTSGAINNKGYPNINIGLEYNYESDEEDYVEISI